MLEDVYGPARGRMEEGPCRESKLLPTAFAFPERVACWRDAEVSVTGLGAGGQ